VAYTPRPGFDELTAELKQGRLHLAYLLWGEEDFLLGRAVAAVVKAALDGDTDDPWNLVRFDAASGGIPEALRAATELPMLRERKVVVVDGLTHRDAHGFVKLAAKKAEKDGLQRYLDDPSPFTVLVLTGSVADYKQKLLTSSAALHVYQMSPPTPARLLRWIPGKATASGLRMTPDAADALLALVGPSMRHLSNEIEKMALYCEEGGTATEEVVRALVEGSAEDSVYALSDAVAGGDLTRALRILRRVTRLHTDGEIRVLNELRRSFLLWFRIRERLDAGQSPQAMAGVLRVPAFVVNKNLAGARRWSLSAFGTVLGELLRIEQELKSGRGDSRVRLELLLLRLLQVRREPAGATGWGGG
jgi:DNA polymerase-3 subunit delta